MTTDGRDPSKTFCILPWMHLLVMPEGATRLCCVANQPIDMGGAPASVQTHDLETIWNSPHMRRVRLRMLEGQHVADCSHCYVAEKQGGYSHRIQCNTRWAEQLGDHYLDRVHEATRRDHVVAEPPFSYQLIPGNNCNLKCRMCFPVFSSRIEHDEVHSAWAGPTLQPSLELINLRDKLDWTKGKVSLGPHSHAGVDVAGMHVLEVHKGLPCRWTDGDVQISAELPNGVRGRSVRLQLWGYHPRKHRLRVSINGQSVFYDVVPCKNWEQTFAVPEGTQKLLNIRLQSDIFAATNDPRELGVAVREIELTHVGTAQPETQSPTGERLPNGPWYRDDAWIREVLFKNVDQIEGLYFTGGEPLIEKQVEKILDHLIERKAAGNVVLEINTNCTVVRDEMMAKLAQFKKVTVALSLDAYGPYHEYIRYPAKWDVIRRNVEKMAASSSDRLNIVATPVVQVYNALNLAEVFAFFDTMRIPYSTRFATVPWYLAVDVLPPGVKQQAAARLKAYAERCPAQQRDGVLSTAEQIATSKNRCNNEAMRTLMQFTNDLDASRGQDVRQVHPDLLQLLQAEGFSWTNERVHAAA